MLNVTTCTANGKPVILLLFNAGPLDITWAKFNPAVNAILECFFPGQETGNSIYATLTASGGTASVPAARLPATWPSYLSQVSTVVDCTAYGRNIINVTWKSTERLICLKCLQNYVSLKSLGS